MSVTRFAYVCTWMVVLSGCASIDVRKVPSQSDYQNWSDAKQAAVDDIRGVRYYMPRPYVAVHQSFPVRTDIYFARGVVSPDGTSVFITDIAGADEATKKQLGAAPVEIKSRLVATSPSGGERPFGAQGESDDKPKDAKQATTAPVKPEPPSSQPVEPVPPKEPEQRPPGISEQRVTNDNGAFAFQPLRGSFDIVYLPDFEEQYAVSVKQGLGDAKYEMAMGQAWSLQGLNSKVDNTQINGLIMGLLSKAADLATQGMTGLFSKLVPPLPAGQTGAFTPQGETEDTKTPGIQVSLRIVVVHYAAQGLYPILKGKEIASLSRLVGSQPSQVQNWATASPGTFTLPLYPYQRVSFNTFRYIGVEVIRPSNPAFQTLYPATGTDAAPVNTSLKDIAEAMRELYGTGSNAGGGGGTGGGKAPTGEEAKRAELIKRLSAMTVPAAVTAAEACYTVGPNTEFSTNNASILVDLKKNPNAAATCGTPEEAVKDLQEQADAAAKRIPYDKTFKIVPRTPTTSPAEAPGS